MLNVSASVDVPRQAISRLGLSNGDRVGIRVFEERLA